MDLFNFDINNVSLDDNNCDSHDPKTIIRFRLRAWCNRHKQDKACKKQYAKN